MDEVVVVVVVVSPGLSEDVVLAKAHGILRDTCCMRFEKYAEVY